MGRNYRQVLIAGVTFVSGLYFFLEFVLPGEINGYEFVQFHQQISYGFAAVGAMASGLGLLNIEFVLPERVNGFEFGLFHQQISYGFVTVGAMAVGLGLINILRVHGGAVARAKSGWGNSLALLLGLLVMFVFEGGDFFRSLNVVDSWQQVSNLSPFSKKVEKDFKEEGIAAVPRLEILLGVLTEVNSKVLANAEPFTTTLENEKSKQLRASLIRKLEKASTETTSLIGLYQSETATGAQLTEAHKLVAKDLSLAGAEARDFVTVNYSKTSWREALLVLRKGIFFPLGAAMFSLLGFYIATAAYRSFRIRSIEASIMMLAAVVVILGQIPHGPLYIWDGLPGVRHWILVQPNTAAGRAIYFGSTIAGLAMAIRMWLSLEKSPLAVDDEE